ncbi:methylmalonyl Co-A mutase-associated GTPase MeaB [Eudoraea chungangensis]|uniref:methylmalonyl Co-A mutase-associated GTPase MeaB n=1 Tax=Eudoraea chungangensis TaxID=1481905 RepID=UPI0023EDBA48|nr:methylmalonyl Co-A mutase-associated GTPase MeaB [Eudoraea chungangensis]
MGNIKNTGEKGVAKVRAHRKKKISVKELTSKILAGEKSALARAITLVESKAEEDQKKANQLIENCLAVPNNSIRIGITGVPGVGKSTFIEALGKTILAAKKKVAILAVDPSSSISKGSILGDKTRMQELVKESNVFIRPSPSGDSLGGVARKTRESIILCEAAGYNCILIETVGVGQSEIAVHSMVDFFLLLKLAGAGDELQGMKRGIMEMADAIVINKAEGDNLKRALKAEVEFERALQLYPPKENGWLPKVSTCSALDQTGIEEVWVMFLEYFKLVHENGFWSTNREKQNQYWFRQTVDDLLKQHFYLSPSIKEELAQYMSRVSQNKISPFRAAEELLAYYKQELK